MFRNNRKVNQNLFQNGYYEERDKNRKWVSMYLLWYLLNALGYRKYNYIRNYKAKPFLKVESNYIANC